MSAFDNVFICGDSHGASFSLSTSGKDLNFSTLGGYGIFSLFDKRTHRPVPASFHAGVLRYFKSLPKDSIIFLSYTDTESRTGIGERVLNEDFKNEYSEIVKKSFDLLYGLSSFKKLVVLDIFSCIKEKADEQTCSPTKRIENRQFLNNLVSKCESSNVDIITTFKNPLFDNDDGTAKNRLAMVDKVHYNFEYILENGQTVSEWVRSNINKHV